MNTSLSSPLVRYEKNPVLTEKDIPWECTSVFNAGVCSWQGGYAMLFRTDSGDRAAPPGQLTCVGLATSQDGYSWDVDPDPVFNYDKLQLWLAGEYASRFGKKEVVRVYDPRLTIVDGEAYLCFALDTAHGIRGGIAKSKNLRDWELLNISLPENRNMVLFPERVNGNLVRLDRPFPLYLRGARESFDVWCSQSPDGRYWGDHKLLLGAEEVPYANAKIGPGAPPIKTAKGWLTTIHAVKTHVEKPLFSWSPNPWMKEYMAGLILLDLEDPSRVIGMATEPLLVSEADYELEGFRGSVIFPGGFLSTGDGKIRMYYGAADTVVAVAEASEEELLAMIKPL